MFDKVYVVVDTTFYGPSYGYIAEKVDLTSDQFETMCDEYCIMAADEYAWLMENSDVPYDELYESVYVSSITVNRPEDSTIIWIN